MGLGYRATLDGGVQMAFLKMTCEISLKWPCGVWGQENDRIAEKERVQRSYSRNGHSILRDRKKASSSR